MKNLLIITPHLSTGGCPQVVANKIELLKNDYNILCVEYECIAWSFIVQKNRIIKSIGEDRLKILGQNKEELFDIINNFKPDIISLEEIPEYFMSDEIANRLYNSDRTYSLFETTHDSSFPVQNKRWFPDKFIFVSAFNAFRYSMYDIPYEIVEYPIDKKEQNKNECLSILGLDPSWKHVVNVGLFTPRKNQKYLFEIAEKLKDHKIKFHFIGNQAGNFENYWKPLMDNKPDNCVVWGERDDVDTFLNASDLFFFGSKGDKNNKELNPIALKEALEYDLPMMMYNLDVYVGKYDNEPNISFLTGNIDVDSENLIKLINPTKVNIAEELIIIGTYPNTIKRKQLTIDCINSLKPTGRKIMLVSHYPVSDEIQNMVDYYVYDAHNPTTHHSYYTRFYHYMPDYDVEININGLRNSNQSLTVLTNINNGMREAKRYGYSKILYMTYDVILNELDLPKVDDIFEKIKSYGGYVATLPTPFEKGIETTSMGWDVDYFMSVFEDIREPSLYNRKCEELKSQNFLEDFFMKKLNGRNEVLIETNDDRTLLKHSGVGVSSNSEYCSILPVVGNENEFMFYFFTHNKDERKIVLKLKENGVSFFTNEYYISQSNFYRKKITYSGKPLEIEIGYWDGIENVKNEIYTINNDTINKFRQTGFFKWKKPEVKPKIKIVHLQTNRNDEREQKSRESLQPLVNYGFEYKLHQNTPYVDLPPQFNCMRPNCVSKDLFDGAISSRGETALTPAHYGCYESFKNGILSEFDSDVDFLIVCEGDCIIEVPYDEFVDKVFKAAQIVKNEKIDYFSFGDTATLDHGWLQSNVVKTIPNEDWLFITNKIIGLQCIMFPKHIKDFLFEQLLKHKWDAADIYFNTIFVDNNKTLGIIKDRITTQADGLSFLDREEKVFRKK
jgi:glycosyltransferase involved in cell wall biosynthesis